jgi:hypothetical protein
MFKGLSSLLFLYYTFFTLLLGLEDQCCVGAKVLEIHLSLRGRTVRMISQHQKHAPNILLPISLKGSWGHSRFLAEPIRIQDSFP